MGYDRQDSSIIPKRIKRKEGIEEVECKIGCIHGDGIGPEIVEEAKKVLEDRKSVV